MDVRRKNGVFVHAPLPSTDRRFGESSKPIDRLSSILIAGNFLPFRLKISPNDAISWSNFVDSSELSPLFGRPPLAQPLLRLQSAVKQQIANRALKFAGRTQPHER